MPQIVGLGLATVDVLVRLGDMPTWDGNCHVSEIRFEGGGPVATGLVAAARLGASTGFIGTAGDDDIGDFKRRGLEREGVDVSQMPGRHGPEDRVFIVLVHQKTGERVFVFAGRSRHDPVRVEELDHDYITAATYLHLDSHHTEAAVQAAMWMREAGKSVVLDAGKTNGPVNPATRSLVELTDVLICGSGFGLGLTGEQDLWTAGEAMLSLGPRIVVQTEGKHGSYTVTAADRFRTPAFDVDVVDTTGAGDVFHGAYIVGLLQGWDLRRVALFASAVSALKCTRLGGRAAIPSLGATLAFLAARGVIVKGVQDTCH